MGLAVPGLVRAADGLVRNAPHLRWIDEPLRDMVADVTGAPTVVGNDAMLGAIAEHLFGAARGVDDVVYLNGGASGIGGGLIIGGVPVPGAGGYAGEFGQNRPGIASASDRRAGDGVLEDEVSRARLLAAVELMTADEPTLAEALRSSRSVTVTEEIARQRRILATALANAVNVLNPSVVVLGGFLAILAEQDLDGLVGGRRRSGDARQHGGAQHPHRRPGRRPAAHRCSRVGVRRPAAGSRGVRALNHRRQRSGGAVVARGASRVGSRTCVWARVSPFMRAMSIFVATSPRRCIG